MTLNEIGVRNGTDKSTLRHNYLGLYELLFARFGRLQPIFLLEAGIQFGNSIRTWREYFPWAHITGIDCVDNKAQGPHEAIFGDAYSKKIVDRLPRNHFHIIIEDGSHNEYDQAFTVGNYPDLLTQDGILIIEDIASLEVTSMLARHVPAGFNHATIDLRTCNPGVPDNILFLVYRK